MRRRVEETLDLLGIADLRARDLRTLSGGQQQRVAIGSVLTTHPRVLVLDEPTSALDPTAAEDVLATITRLVHDLGLTVLLAEHRLERVVPFADRICLVTGDGGIRVDEPAHGPRRLAGRAAAGRARPPRRLGPAAAHRPRRPRGTHARCRRSPRPTVVPLPRPSPLLDRPRRHRRPRHHVAVREVDLTLSAGRVTVLMGRNGSGKSSLIWALQGSGKRRSGTLDVDGDDPAHARARPAAYARRAGAADRRRPALPRDRRRRVRRRRRGRRRRRPAPAAGSSTGSLPASTRPIHPRDLSEGQRLALALAIVLTARPPVLLLDEPTRGLDYAGKAELARIVADLAADGRAVLLATHDVEFAAHVADEVVVLAEGEVVSSGPPQRVLAESPSFAPQVTKVLGAPWLVVEEVAAALEESAVSVTPGGPPDRTRGPRPSWRSPRSPA